MSIRESLFTIHALSDRLKKLEAKAKEIQSEAESIEKQIESLVNGICEAATKHHGDRKLVAHLRDRDSGSVYLVRINPVAPNWRERLIMTELPALEDAIGPPKGRGTGFGRVAH